MNNQDYLFINTNLENTTYPQPDLIFLDINMPVMDGWEFMQVYHKLDENKKGNKVIVMLTTSINPDDKLKASLISEITDFKSKPLFPDNLEELVKKYFPEKFE
jgi:CheY-like chemotaxis protein